MKNESRLDLATCLGVPISAGKEESAAMQEWLAFKADAIIQYSSNIIELRDACLGEDVLGTEDPLCPPSMVAFESLGYFRRCWDHILRNVPRTVGLNPHIVRIDDALDADLIRADRYVISSTVPLARILPVLHRNSQNGGANIRTLGDAADPALLSSLTNIFELVATRVQINTADYENSERGRQLKNVLGRVKFSAAGAEQRFETAKAKYPDLAVPPARQLPCNIAKRGGGNVLSLLRVAAPPKRILQKDMTKTIDYYNNMADYFDPCLLGLPGGWGETRKIRYMRTVSLKACARNGTGVYRLGVSRRNVVTGSKISIKFTEAEYLVAKRQQLGLGFEGAPGGGSDWGLLGVRQ